MPIDAICPAGHRLIAADHRAGQTVRCPICSQPVELPPTVPLSNPADGMGETRKLSGELPLSRASLVNSTALSFSFDASETNENASQPSPVSEGSIRSGSLSTGSQQGAPSNVRPSESLTRSGAYALVHQVESHRVYRGRRIVVGQLAAGLVALTLVSLAPVFSGQHWNLAESPTWVRLVVMLALLQLVYVIWMLTVPDWSTVWVAMIVFAVAASIYSMGLAIAITTRDGDLDRMSLELHDVRRQAVLWCAVMLAGSSLATYACGRISYVWHRKVKLIGALHRGT